MRRLIPATYIHERKGWPTFYWDAARLSDRLAAIRHRQGLLIGKMEGLGFGLQNEASLQTLTEDVLKSSAIEGERLDREQVRSSLARRLGSDIGGLKPADRHVEGVVEMMLDATQAFGAPLTRKRLFGWHAALFPTGHNGLFKIRVGHWRDDRNGPMQVVSGPAGRERVHYQAPEAKRLDSEMRGFLAWLEDGPPIDPVLKAGIAHFWFVTLHPFDDGNGRIARAIADLALARSEGHPRRFYSMSAQICAERDAYYRMLENTQKGELDITPWLEWFLGCLGRAFERTEKTLASVLAKARFWESHRDERFNDRQKKALNRLLDGVERKLTSSRWASLGKCSQDTASRDIEELIKRRILVKNPGGGRSTSYSLAT
jgi:Fic family protein